MTQHIETVLEAYAALVAKFNDHTIVDVTTDFVAFLGVSNANLVGPNNPITGEELAEVSKLWGKITTETGENIRVSPTEHIMLFEKIPPELPEYCISIAILRHWFYILKGLSKIDTKELYSSTEWNEWKSVYAKTVLAA